MTDNTLTSGEPNQSNGMPEPHARELPAALAIQRVLVPVDGTPYATRSLPYATTFARAVGVGITLAYVRTPYAFDANRQIATESTKRAGSAQSDVSDYPTYLAWMRQETLARVADVEIEMLDADSVSKGVLQLEAKEPGAVVALASHVYQGMERLLLGSIAGEVVRNGRAPVLVVPPRVVSTPATIPALARVIVPLDGSLLAESALSPVLGLLAAHAESSLRQEPIDVLLLSIAESHITLPHTQRYLEQLQKKIEPTLSHSSATITIQAAVGPAPHAIVAAVERLGAGQDETRPPTALLALATHGRGGLGQLLYGSVAQFVLPRIAVPVLLVHPRATDM